MDDYKKSNDILDEMKKAHQKELAAYIQEHNKKYNELLKEKLNSEDALKAQYDTDKVLLIKEWQQKVKEAAEKARTEEQTKGKYELDKLRKDYDGKIEVLEGKIKRLEGDVQEGFKAVKDKEKVIGEKEKVIGEYRSGCH